MAQGSFNSMVIPGLESSSACIGSAGNYTIIGKLQLPSVTDGSSANSSVVSTVKQNGTTIFTSQAGSSGFRINLPCAAGDIIQVSLSSAAAVDQPPAAVRCTVAIG